MGKIPKQNQTKQTDKKSKLGQNNKVKK